MTPRGFRLYACATAALALAGCTVNLNAERITRSEERRFTVTGKPEVSLKTFDGAIRVQSWDKPEVLVTIERQAGDEESLKSIEVKSNQEGNRITVEVTAPEHTGGIVIGEHVGRSASLTVSLPRETDVTARSGDGAVAIENVAGRLDVNTGDGAINVRGSRGDMSVRTGDGAVALEDVRGQVELTTGDGAVRVDGVLQRVKARTGDGGVTIRASEGSTAGTDWDIESGDGSVTIDLPDGFGAELEARTGDGRVSLQNLTLSDMTKDDEDKALKGRIGAGGSRLIVRTGDGSITLGKR
jgi:Putative adhesin